MRKRPVRSISFAWYWELWRIKAHNKLGICVKVNRSDSELGTLLREYYPSKGLLKWALGLHRNHDMHQMDFRGGTRFWFTRRKDEENTE